jgi:hypothetical protein
VVPKYLNMGILSKIQIRKAGVALHTYNPNTQEAEAKDGELEVSLGYVARTHLTTTTSTKYIFLSPTPILVN